MTKIDMSKEALTPFLRKVQGLSNEGAHLETITEGIRDHVAFFVDVVESKKLGRAVVTVASTVEGLRLLGCDASFTAAIGLPNVARGSKLNNEFGGHALTDVFAKNQGNGIGGPVFVDELGKVGIRGQRDGIRADTGSFRKEDGSVDPEKAATFFLNVGGGKPYATLGDLKVYLNQGSYPGKLLNELEFRLAFDLFAQDGKLTAAHWVAFLDGTAWEGLAKARMDGTKLYQPVGEPKHDSAKKVAQILAQQTGALGGLYANAGTAALYAAAGIADNEETRERQQAMKNLGPTLGGAIAMLCPFKGMIGNMKPQEASAT